MYGDTSTDGTAEYLSRLPRSQVVVNKTNQGFARACNQAFQRLDTDYLLLLNNDTTVTPGWLERMYQPFLRYPEIGITAPCSNYVAGAQRIQVNYSDLSGLNALAKQLAVERAGQGFFNHYAAGLCMLIKRNVIDKVGGFDQCFGLGNFEDDDFCLRVQLAGYKIWVAADAFIHHVGSATFQHENIDYQRSMENNWRIFKKKWGLPKDAPLHSGYRYDKLLDQQFSKGKHYIPLNQKGE